MTEFTMRPATLADLEAVVEFHNLWEEDHAGTRSSTIEEMKIEWTLPGFDLCHSSRLILTPEEEIIGYVMVRDIANPAVKPSVRFCVHPDRANENVDTLLLDWAETRSRECLNRVPADVRVVMQSGALSTFIARKERLERAGFQLKRHYFDMEITLDTQPPAPKWPANIDVSHYETFADVMANLRETLNAFNEAFRDHYGHVERSMDEALKIWKYRLENDPDFDPTLWFIARDGPDIAGLSLCWPKSWEDPEAGYLGILAVRRPWRKKGLGMALLHHSFNAFYERGKPKVTLGVDGSSLTGAVALYERAGMHLYKQFDAYEKELRPGRDLSTQAVS